MTEKITPISEILQEALCGYDQNGNTSTKYIAEKSFIKWGLVETDLNAVFNSINEENKCLRELLRKHQWSVPLIEREDGNYESTKHVCPDCFRQYEEGHDDDCEIKKAIGKG